MGGGAEKLAYFSRLGSHAAATRFGGALFNDETNLHLLG